MLNRFYYLTIVRTDDLAFFSDLSRRAERRTSTSEALKPLKDIVVVLEDKLLKLETSIKEIRQSLEEQRNPYDRLSRPRYRRSRSVKRSQSTMDNRPRFNPFVRSRHTGLSPYRSNFNMQTYSDSTRTTFAPRYLEVTSNTNSTKSISNQGVGISGRPRFGAITNQVQNGVIESRKTGAIPKQPVSKVTKRDKENRPEDLNLVVERPDKAAKGKRISIAYDNLPEPPNGPTFHRERLQAETQRLMDLANELETIRASVVELPEWIGGDIDAVVGGIKLMVSSKFEQFRELIEECATRFRVPSCIPVPGKKKNRPNRPVKPAVLPDDLDGFWEMMNVQAKAINKKVMDLQVLKENNWEPVLVIKRPKRKPASSNAKTSKTAVGKSNFREFLRKQKEAKCEPKEEVTSVTTVGSDGLIEQGAVGDVVVPPQSPRVMNVVRDRRVTFVTPNLLDFATPSHTEATPMPTTPMIDVWMPDGDLSGQSIDLEFNVDIVSSTPATFRDSGCETMNGTKFASFDFSGIEDLTTLFRTRLSKSRGIEDLTTPFRTRLSKSRESFMTPRVAQNLMKARNSRRSSVDIIMQSSILGRVVSTREEEEEFTSPCNSPISEASSCPSLTGEVSPSEC
ncbi:hypothetical protein GE061_019602 [Apolygus lucorum]|uniref:Uncharacterized protein n=1 Tax=Apolygus lucorum TaxID=248454 RepID=A0A8S9X8M3_APOLU|nr:hypothetical protein GE061_019602 [Apolygus lucorum]